MPKDFYFDEVDSAIKCRNDRNGDFLIRIALDNDDDDFIVKKDRKPEFVEWLKKLIRELEK